MISVFDKSKLATAIGDHGVVSSGGREIRFCCPFCNDSDRKRHLWVSASTGKWICYRCGAKGSSIVSLLRKVGFVGDVGGSSLFSYLEEEKRRPDMVPPPGFRELTVYDALAWDYLIRVRGLSVADITYYRIGVDGRGRIILPDYDPSGKLIYWVARKLSGGGPKYIAPPDADKVIWGYHRVSGVFPVVSVVEGVFSAMAAGRNAVAMFGKTIGDSQVRDLSRMKVDVINCLLDGDATKENWDLARRLAELGVRCQVTELPSEHDPASISKEELQGLMSSAPFFSERLFMFRSLLGWNEKGNEKWRRYLSSETGK